MKTLFLLPVLALCANVHAADPAAPANPHAGMNMNMHGTAAPVIQLTQQATVLSTLSVPDYTYIEVAQGKSTLWLAATRMAVKKGDIVRFDDGMVMENFYSKSLKRTFPRVVFVNRAVVGGAQK